MDEETVKAVSVKTSATLRAWPSPQDYNEAVQNPHLVFNRAELTNSEPVLNELGLPKPATGNFASVYQLRTIGRDVAVRCFLRPISDQESRYQALSTYLENADLDCLVDFQYLEKGILVYGQWYPIVEMDWVRGQGLIEYISANLGNPRAIAELAENFKQTCLQLRGHGIAHGDLQHGNIIIENGTVRLVDYDGAFVPALAGLHSNETGHANYQHPKRSAEHFSEQLDNFSARLIYLSLMTLSEDPSLWHRLRAGDECLLLRKRDLQNPGQSKTFAILERHPSMNIRLWSRMIRTMLNMDPLAVPPLDEDFLPSAQLPEIGLAQKPKEVPASDAPAPPLLKALSGYILLTVLLFVAMVCEFKTPYFNRQAEVFFACPEPTPFYDEAGSFYKVCDYKRAADDYTYALKQEHLSEAQRADAEHRLGHCQQIAEEKDFGEANYKKALDYYCKNDGGTAVRLERDVVDSLLLQHKYKESTVYLIDLLKRPGASASILELMRSGTNDIIGLIESGDNEDAFPLLSDLVSAIRKSGNDDSVMIGLKSKLADEVKRLAESGRIDESNGLRDLTAKLFHKPDTADKPQ